jgi:hypothetical protein
LTGGVSYAFVFLASFVVFVAVFAFPGFPVTVVTALDAFARFEYPSLNTGGEFWVSSFTIVVLPADHTFSVLVADQAFAIPVIPAYDALAL